MTERLFVQRASNRMLPMNSPSARGSLNYKKLDLRRLRLGLLPISGGLTLLPLLAEFDQLNIFWFYFECVRILYYFCECLNILDYFCDCTNIQIFIWEMIWSVKTREMLIHNYFKVEYHCPKHLVHLKELPWLLCM